MDRATGNKCRKEVLSLFNGQKLLLIEGEGHGKSSFIKTVNHAIRLSNPDVLNLACLTTTAYTKNRGLFRGVSYSKD